MTPYSVACDLAACLCAELTPIGTPGNGLCFCGVLPGDTIVADVGNDCDEGCGMAWTRIVSAYPSKVVGEVYVEPNTCGSAIGVDIEVGVLRCYPIPDNGEPPEPEVLEAAAATQSEDMMAMYRTVKCCDALQAFGIDYLLGLYTPTGPLGGVVGGTWSVSVIF